MTDAINIDDYEQLARSRLTKSAYDYYASGAHDELTLGENRRAFERLKIRYRVLVDVSERTAATELLGQKISAPLIVAPTAFHGMAHPEGELATVRAAGRANTIMVLSSLANTAVEDVCKAATGPVWFQLYVYKDRGATEAVVRRAEAAGAQALVLTVDAPLLGVRERDVRNQFHLPEGLAVKNLLPEGYGEIEAPPAGSGLAAYFVDLIDASLSWRDMAWLRSLTSLPILIKGIVRGDDARRAVEHGADCLVVSNHGGRQLDGAPATIEVLPEIAEAVDGRAEILLDGGVRRGTDLIKAVALGAKAVMVGRPILWGLAAKGEEGALAVLRLLMDELDLSMALSGCAHVGEMTSDLIWRGPAFQ